RRRGTGGDRGGGRRLRPARAVRRPDPSDQVPHGRVRPRVANVKGTTPFTKRRMAQAAASASRVRPFVGVERRHRGRARPRVADVKGTTPLTKRRMARAATYSVRPMKTRTLGAKGPEVTVVGLGTNNFGARCNYEQSLAVIDEAIEQGITLFDTADIYSQGTSEEF